ncbi:hypothetical protein XU18_2185 [Perkinsela sp. CCAP 1560/4]|nr:hypothetical protein XU18_2185 [Perkinsela sp. CCAP 1560/4]|eukprot:KNH07140.1 hypothetical protein XU18_2185 [Perkinsela sp. CCAP 1560/4]
MNAYPYEDTALRLALESSMEDISHSPNSGDSLSIEMKDQIRRLFVEAMNESLSKHGRPERSVYVRSAIDPSGEYPVYRVENGRANVFLKDAEVTLTSEYGNSQEVIKADYVKLDVFPRSHKFNA